MAKRIIALLLALLMLLCCGCSGQEPSAEPAATTEATEATVPATVPADGDPGDVTCKGSYTADTPDPDAVVAKAADQKLTNAQLQVWYRLAVAERAQSLHYDAAPDFSRPLDTQSCPIDDSVNSWQQYFLKQALNAWHSAAALELQSREVPLATEEAYQPNLENYEKYMTGMPATEFLYGYNPMYEPNSLHEAYLEALPETLDALAEQKGYASAEELAQAAFGTSAEALEEAVRMYNFSYAYFTTLGYYLEPAEEAEAPAQVISQEDRTVDIRHILLIPHVPEPEPLPAWLAKTTEPTEAPEEVPQVTVAEDGTVTCPEELWTACLTEAEALIADWQKDRRCSGATFSELAVKLSADAGSSLNGGIYRNLRQGQLMEELDAWCFDPARQSGDTTVIRSRYGVHVLYFTGANSASGLKEDADNTSLKMQELVLAAREQYPAEIDYSAIVLADGQAEVSFSDVLYPDIAHQRFPEVPLYLQQDYPTTKYGAFWIRTHGCGITTMAMLASYMADDELTPPEMCARYGNYSFKTGTDGMIFNYEPAVMGFYLREKTYEPSVAKAALEEGQIVISVQHKGYWTRGGHYLVLEKIDENGVQVRDSNIYNYSRVPTHAGDRHTWGSITNAGSGYWIFEDKITRIPACSRCGTPEEMVDGLLTEEYLCEKCTPALLRRNAYLTGCTEDICT